jgi:hypothetical protein
MNLNATLDVVVVDNVDGGVQVQVHVDVEVNA